MASENSANDSPGGTVAYKRHVSSLATSEKPDQSEQLTEECAISGEQSGSDEESSDKSPSRDTTPNTSLLHDKRLSQIEEVSKSAQESADEFEESHPQQAPPPLDEDLRRRLLVEGNLLPAAFKNESSEIAKDVVYHIVYGSEYEAKPVKRCTVMRSLVRDILKTRRSMMLDLVEKLDITECGQLLVLHNLADQIFDDQIVNWGRIVTFHAYCALLARNCCQHNVEGDCVESIVDILRNIVINRLGLWIISRGGWKAFEDQFPPVFMWCSRQNLWKIFAFIGLLLGAIYAFYSSIKSVSGPS